MPEQDSQPVPVAAAAHSSAAATRKSVWTEGVTEPVQLCFQNKAGCRLEVHWVDYDGQLQQYSTISPAGVYTLSSYSTHPWTVKYEEGHSVSYTGGSALLVLLPGGELRVQPYQQDPDADDSSWQDPAWGPYTQRGSVLDMPIMAYACVCQEAVQQVAHVAQHMLAGCHSDIVQRMVAAGCNIAIIGRHQVTTDIPAHRFMRAHSKCEGARDIDATTRGLGATPAVPTTSCGEENITMVEDRRYPHENILIHELVHAVMNLGLDQQQMQRVHQCFDNAQEQGLYAKGCYMMQNAEEFFAEGCQSWFDATVRTDVNGGINTRCKLKARDPLFAQLLAEVFGDGAWCYPHTAPATFGHQHAEQQQDQQQDQEQEKGQEGSTASGRRRLSQQAAEVAAAGAGSQSSRHTSQVETRSRTRGAAERLAAQQPQQDTCQATGSWHTPAPA